MRRTFAVMIGLALTWGGSNSKAGAADIAVLMPGSHGITPGDFLVRSGLGAPVSAPF
jgi:hypothetical protein